MSNPIIQRELISALRSPKALAMQVIPACVFALLVVLRWPTDARVDLSGSQARQVFQIFGYGLLATLILLVPAFPAATIIREKSRGTLALLLNSPMSPWSIYFGKLIGVMAFVLLPLAMSLPAAAACYAMGGLSLSNDLLVLYGILVLLTLQIVTLGLFVSSSANSTDAALRLTYGLTFCGTVLVLGPFQFLQGQDRGSLVTAARWLQAVSPIPAAMEILGHGDAGGHGLLAAKGNPGRYAIAALATAALCVLLTVRRLRPDIFDRPRSQGIVTDDRGAIQQWFRRVLFLIDPQRRKGAIGRFTNPVMIKELRCRRFGRSHWMLRLIAFCAIASLGLTYTSTQGTLDWGVETVGGLLVILQVALIILITPSLAAGLISSERESGGWALLQMTPLSPRQIVTGKLLSVAWTQVLILCATLPGYVVMIYIQPSLTQTISRVLICLALTAVFALLLSAAVSSLFQRTAPATVTAYALLLAICGGPLLLWLGRDTAFGQGTIEVVLMLDPLAAALNVMDAPGFSQYCLVPANWWIIGTASLAALGILVLQTWRLSRPQ